MARRLRQGHVLAISLAPRGLHFLHAKRLSDRETIAQQGFFLFPVLAKQAGSNLSRFPSRARRMYRAGGCCRATAAELARAGFQPAIPQWISADTRRRNCVQQCYMVVVLRDDILPRFSRRPGARAFSPFTRSGCDRLR